MKSDGGREIPRSEVLVRRARAFAGRPPDDAEQLALLVSQCADPDTTVTRYSCSGEEIGEAWAGYRVEMALVPLEAFYRIAPQALLFSLPSEGDIPYVIVRWRAWIIGAASWQEDWYDYDLSRWRQAVYAFPSRKPIAEPLRLAQPVAQRAHRGMQLLWSPVACDDFLRALHAALAQKAATGGSFNKRQVCDAMGKIDRRAYGIVPKTLENYCKRFQVDYVAEKRRAIEASRRQKH